MAAEIILLASDAWNYFQKCKDELKTHMHLIAQNTEYGTEVYITEDKGLPNVVIIADGQQVHEETMINAIDCKETLEGIYDKFLTASAISSLSEDYNDELYVNADADESEDDEYDEAVISRREDVLYEAIYDFLSLASDDYLDLDSPEVSEIIEDCKEHFLEYIARKHSVPVYRPMVLEYDDGTEEVSEFPYEDMEFDDPDNPLYK